MVRGMQNRAIESPYLVPSKSLLELLDKELRQGVQVRMLTNSLHSSDGILPYAAFLKYRRRLVRSGIEVREFKGPTPRASTSTSLRIRAVRFILPVIEGQL